MNIYIHIPDILCVNMNSINKVLIWAWALPFLVYQLVYIHMNTHTYTHIPYIHIYRHECIHTHT